MRSTFHLSAVVKTIGVALALTVASPSFAETIKLGLSVPLSGSGANWGKGSQWLCNKAAKEVNDQGGVKVAGKTYTFECLAACRS